MKEFIDLLAALIFTMLCLLIYQKWVYCHHEDKDIIPVGFADWKCSKCGVES